MELANEFDSPSVRYSLTKHSLPGWLMIWEANDGLGFVSNLPYYRDLMNSLLKF